MSTAKRLEAVKRLLVYEVQRPIGDLRRDIEKLRTLDRHHEQRQLWFRRLAFLVGLPTIVVVAIGGLTLLSRMDFGDSELPAVLFFVVLIALSSAIAWYRARATVTFQPARESTAGKILAPACGIGLAALIWYLYGSKLSSLDAAILVGVLVVGLAASGLLVWAYYHHSRLNLEDRRYELAGELLQMLERDVDPDAPVDLRLDLGPADDTDKMVRKDGGGLWTLRFYDDPWLQLAGRLLDGTRFALCWTDKVKTKTRVKSKGRVKKKRKSKSAVALKLKVKADKYPHLQELSADARRAVQLPRATILKSMEIEPGALALKVEPDDDWASGEEPGSGNGARGVEIVAKMFLSLYQVLTLARQLRKRERVAAG